MFGFLRGLFGFLKTSAGNLILKMVATFGWRIFTKWLEKQEKEKENQESTKRVSEIAGKESEQLSQAIQLDERILSEERNGDLERIRQMSPLLFFAPKTVTAGTSFAVRAKNLPKEKVYVFADKQWSLGFLVEDVQLVLCLKNSGKRTLDLLLEDNQDPLQRKWFSVDIDVVEQSIDINVPNGS